MSLVRHEVADAVPEHACATDAGARGAAPLALTVKQKIALAAGSSVPASGILVVDDHKLDYDYFVNNGITSTALASAGLRLIAATIVINGTIERSWNSRIENARSPNGVFIRPDERSIGRTCAVARSRRPMSSNSANCAFVIFCGSTRRARRKRGGLKKRASWRRWPSDPAGTCRGTRTRTPGERAHSSDA